MGRELARRSPVIRRIITANIKPGHKPGFSCLESQIPGSFQQPLFRSMQIRKCIDIYTSITSRQREKLL
jgi:hypothetical protein